MTKDIEREAFEITYQPDPQKSPFPYFLFNEEKNLYEAHSFDGREVSLINAAWWGWQAAKAHEAKKLEGCVVVPSNSVTLTCEQLLTVLQYGAPDLQIERTEYSEEQMDTEMSIVWLEDGHSGKGYYAYYTDLPEEGSINLDLMEGKS